jgi:GTPase SAR1 family protein
MLHERRRDQLTTYPHDWQGEKAQVFTSRAHTLARQLDGLLNRKKQIDLPLLSSACRLLVQAWTSRLEPRIGGDVVSPAAAVAFTVPPAVMRRLDLELSNYDPMFNPATLLGSCAVRIRVTEVLGGQPGIVMTGAAIEVLRAAVAEICLLIKKSAPYECMSQEDVALLSSQLAQHWSEVLSVLSSEPGPPERVEAHPDFEIAQLNMAMTKVVLSDGRLDEDDEPKVPAREAARGGGKGYHDRGPPQRGYDDRPPPNGESAAAGKAKHCQRLAALVFQAVFSGPNVVPEHHPVVRLGTQGGHAHLCSQILCGLLLRRIPCCLDETRLEGSITVSCGDSLAEVGTWLLDDMLPSREQIAKRADALAYDLAVDHRVERYSDLDIAHSSEADGAMVQLKHDFGWNDRAHEALENRIRLAIQARALEAALERGTCPWRRSRLHVVGQGRAGKTSFVASLFGEPHTGQPTGGVDISEAVRDLGVDIRDCKAAKDGCFWKRSKGGPETDRAVAAHANLCAKLGLRQRASLPYDNVSDAKKRLWAKYRFGDGSKIKDISKPLEDKHPTSTDRMNFTIATDAGDANDTKASEPFATSAAKEAQTSLEDDGVSAVARVEPKDEPMPSTFRASGASTLMSVGAEDDAAEQIRISVWDYGGQAVFQTIQHLYMPRLGVYVLAFNILDIAEESRRKEALHYLNFWLRSIDMHAANRIDAAKREDEYPPLVLIGTHLDEVEKQEDCARVLRSIDTILKGLFGGKIKSFQSDSDTLIPGREFLYNVKQGLCFFPVNTLDHNDANVTTLRSLLVRAMEEDALDYLEDPIPSTWLRVFDKLATAREEPPLMKIYSGVDDDELTVVRLMREVGARLHMGEDLSKCTDRSPCTECLKQAQAMLQLFHLLGAVVRRSSAQLGFLCFASIGPIGSDP